MALLGSAQTKSPMSGQGPWSKLQVAQQPRAGDQANHDDVKLAVNEVEMGSYALQKPGLGTQFPAAMSAFSRLGKDGLTQVESDRPCGPGCIWGTPS